MDSMRVLAAVIGELGDIPDRTRQAEALGLSGIFTAEINNDPFLPALLAAEHSRNLEIMTSIAVAFARNPMTMANTAYDLQAYSAGRFTLGIGSQVSAHITRRLSMPWSHPAARMREFIGAMRAIWRCWLEGEKLSFEGEFYQHTLMTPMFTPAHHDYGPPQVKLAAVGPLMTQVAGELADGMIAHGFTTPAYLRDVTLPALQLGLDAAGRDRETFDVCCPMMVVTGGNEEEFERSRNAVRMQVAFYGSTPGYVGVLRHHGWEDLQPRLNALSRSGDWDKMGALISDEMLGEFALVCEHPEAVPEHLKSRCASLVDTWQCTVSLDDTTAQQQLIQSFAG